MIPTGLKPLLKLRQAGRRPAGVVWLMLSNSAKQIDWWAYSDLDPQAVIRTSDPVGRLDLRCVVGLHVVVEGVTCLALLRLADRVREYADRVTLHQFDRIETDFGRHWQHGMADWVPLRPWLAGEFR